MNSSQPFNEAQWLKLIYLLADTQQWVDEMSKQAFLQLPVQNKKQLFSNTYYLTPSALMHIVERHYYKINRHPGCAKFHIPLTEVLHHIREAKAIEPQTESCSSNFYRTLQTNQIIGFDNDNNAVTVVTVITHRTGRIITAFPGLP